MKTLTLILTACILCGCPAVYTPEQITEAQAALQTLSDAFAINAGVADWESKLATLDETKVLNTLIIGMRRGLKLRRDQLLVEEASMRGLDPLPDNYLQVVLELAHYTILLDIAQRVTPEQQIDVARIAGYVNLYLTEMEKHITYDSRMPVEITSVLSGSLPQVVEAQ